jgi:hypothetical protein
MYQSNQVRIKKEKPSILPSHGWTPRSRLSQALAAQPVNSTAVLYRVRLRRFSWLSPLDPNSPDNKMLQCTYIAHCSTSGAPNPELNTAHFTLDGLCLPICCCDDGLIGSDSNCFLLKLQQWFCLCLTFWIDAESRLMLSGNLRPA